MSDVAHKIPLGELVTTWHCLDAMMDNYHVRVDPVVGENPWDQLVSARRLVEVEITGWYGHGEVERLRA